VCVCVCVCVGGGEGRTNSKKHVKKLHSILRYAESSQGFTEIKQVSARSIQLCRGSVQIRYSEIASEATFGPTWHFNTVIIVICTSLHI